MLSFLNFPRCNSIQKHMFWANLSSKSLFAKFSMRFCTCFECYFSTFLYYITLRTLKMLHKLREMRLNAQILTEVRFLWRLANSGSWYDRLCGAKKSIAPQMAHIQHFWGQIGEIGKNLFSSQNLDTIEELFFVGTTVCSSDKHILWPTFSLIAHFVRFFLYFLLFPWC